MQISGRPRASAKAGKRSRLHLDRVSPERLDALPVFAASDSQPLPGSETGKVGLTKN